MSSFQATLPAHLRRKLDRLFYFEWVEGDAKTPKGYCAYHFHSGKVVGGGFPDIGMVQSFAVGFLTGRGDLSIEHMR